MKRQIINDDLCNFTGGTADITVHEKLPNDKIKEVYQATGGAWGGTAVDEAYTQLLIKVFSGPNIHQFRREHTYGYMDMMREFEVAKRNMKPDGRISLNTRIPAMLNTCCVEQNGETIQEILQGDNCPYKGKIKVIGDKLSIKSEIMRSIFQFVTKEIVDHISNVLADSKTKDCSLMLLVGGFSESEILQNAIRGRFESEDRRIIVPVEAGLSVVKGVAIAGHALNIVTNRVVRYHYGVSVKAKFDEKKHPEKYKIVDEVGVIGQSI